MGTESAAGLLEGRLYINGAWREAAAGQRFEVTDPSSGERVGTMARAGEADARAAVDAAGAAFPAWAALPAVERARHLKRVAERIWAQLDRIAEIMTREQGKPLAEARGEVNQTAEYFEWNAEEARRVYGDLIPASVSGKRLAVLRQPVGVTAAITPWNFPASMLGRKIAPALAVGCTTVCKPATATPLTAWALFQCMDEAGLPPGVANLVAGPSGPIGEVLLTDPRVRKISFTGSTEVGKELMRRAADQMKKVALELGGHAPFLIFADADLDKAVEGLVSSKYRNAGQTCICANRAYVEEGVAAEFERRLAARVAALRVGPGLEQGVQVGPVIDEDAMARMRAQVEDAVGRGGRVAAGGTALALANRPGGHFFAPTVLAALPRDARLAREETFGPLIGLWSFRDEREAVALANDTPYGLAAYVYTRDLSRAVRVCEGLEYGIIGLNDPLPTVVQAPFGGMKESGVGREGGYEGVLAYLETKYVSIGLESPA